MSNLKITELDALAAPAGTDVLAIVDLSTPETKKATAASVAALATLQTAYDAGEGITQAASTPLTLTNDAGGSGLLVQDTGSGDTVLVDETGVTGDGAANLVVTTAPAVTTGASARPISIGPGVGGPGDAGNAGGAGAPLNITGGKGGPNSTTGDGGVGADGVCQPGGHGGGVTGAGTAGAAGASHFRGPTGGSATTAGGGTPTAGGPAYLAGGPGGGIIPDNAIAADGGPVYVDGGEGAVTDGDVLIGTLHANAITLGSGTTIVTLAGLLSALAAELRGGGNFLTLEERGSDPSTPDADDLALYAKDSSGVSALYARDDAGTVHELTNRAAAADIAAGTYVPTLTGVANVDSAVLVAARYLRVVDVVRVSVEVSVDPTAAAATQLRITFPVASALTAASEVSGVASIEGGGMSGTVKGDATNDEALLDFTSASGSAEVWKAEFSYVVV